MRADDAVPAVDKGWVQPVQNTVAALRFGMTEMDGIELDLRMSEDGELFLHHDARLERSAAEMDDAGAAPFVEENHGDTMRSLGFESFEEALEDRTIRDSLEEGGRTIIIELKRLHWRAKPNGERASRRAREEHMGRMLRAVDYALEGVDAPDRSTVIISFHQAIRKISAREGTQIEAIPINPNVPPGGTDLTRRVRAVPSFVRRSVAGLARHYSRSGAPLVPLALDHVTGLTRHLHLGRSVSLHGAGMERLRAAVDVCQMAIWPSPLSLEPALDEIGVWRITDDADPTVTRRPDGIPRWLRPASQPLDDEWRRRFKAARDASETEVHDLLSEARCEIAPHHESGNRSLPWQAPRAIGHRGAGQTGHGG